MNAPETSQTISNLPRDEALRRRYGPDHALPAMPESAIFDALLRHRSVRAYSSKPLPPGTLELLIAAGQSAATSSNLQVWSVVAVEDQARKDRLSVFANNQAHIRQCPLLLLWVADLSRLDRVAQARGTTAEGNQYLEMLLVGAIDAALAAQNAVVAAESLGLGTVYLGAMRNHPEEVAAEVGLPPNAMVVFGLCVGYEDPAALAADVKPRLSQSTILHHERYSSEHEAAAVAAYNATLNDFQASQNMPASEWSKQSTNRVSVRGLSGRDALGASLRKMGFGIK